MQPVSVSADMGKEAAATHPWGKRVRNSLWLGNAKTLWNVGTPRSPAATPFISFEGGHEGECGTHVLLGVHS